MAVAAAAVVVGAAVGVGRAVAVEQRVTADAVVDCWPAVIESTAG